MLKHLQATVPNPRLSINTLMDGIYIGNEVPNQWLASSLSGSGLPWRLATLTTGHHPAGSWRHLCSRNSAVTANVFLESLAFRDESTFQNDTPFLVSLVLLGGELIDPPELGVTVFARNISDHVAPCQHDTILHFTVVEVHDSVEQESSSSGSWREIERGWGQNMIVWMWICEFCVSCQC